MKTCPKCGTEHEKPGKFCSRACANSRQWTEEHKKVFSEKQTAYMAREESEEHRYKKSIQTTMLARAGRLGGNREIAEDADDIMTNPDDYFFVPPRDEGDNFSDGDDFWEVVR